MNIYKAIFINSYRLSKSEPSAVSKIYCSIGNTIACRGTCSHQFSKINSIDKHICIDRSTAISAILFEKYIHSICVEKSVYESSICLTVFCGWVCFFFAVNIRIPPWIYRYDLIISISPKFPIFAPRV